MSELSENLRPMEDVAERLCALRHQADEVAKIVGGRVLAIVGAAPSGEGGIDSVKPETLRDKMCDSIANVGNFLEFIRDEINRL